MSGDPVGILLTNHPAPWTAWYARTKGHYQLLDARGAVIGAVEDKTAARGLARLINTVARQRTADGPVAQVIPLVACAPVEAPPAPDPLNGVSTTWAELFDHLVFLLEEGDTAGLRKRLFDYARVTVGQPLPDVFTAPNETPGDHRA